MQTHVDDELNQRAIAESEAETREGGAESIAFEQATRPHEELRMLYIGFGTGVLVGIVFLLYIMAATAHLLP